MKYNTKQSEAQLRSEIIRFLRGGVAFMTFDEAVHDFPTTHINTKPPNVSYTFWQLLEHIRITQRDILDFSVNPKYKYITWPDDYWPDPDKTVKRNQWAQTIREIKKDTESMIALVENPDTDLYTPFPWGEGQNLLREAVLVAEHNAYHTGEFAILRQAVGAWPEKRKP